MPKITTEKKNEIRSFSRKDLADIVFLLISKDKRAYNYVCLNYFDPESTSQQLSNQTRSDIIHLFHKLFKGFSIQLQVTNMLKSCIQRLNEYIMLTGTKENDSYLFLLILEYRFKAKRLGTCFSAGDSKLGQILNRHMNLVVKKIHPDFRI